jgi:hypothetical protein
LCALSDMLILDEDGLYNPAHFNDRLLLAAHIYQDTSHIIRLT